MTATDPARARRSAGPDRAPDGPRAGLAALEQERDFLVRSLKDLDAEREAGDIDQGDYRQLKDDYTARAAAVLRAIDSAKSAGTPTVAPRGPVRAAAVAESRALQRRRRRRTAAITAVAVALAAVAAWSVTQSSGSRLPGQSVSGDNRALSSPTSKPTPAKSPAGAAGPASAGAGGTDARLVAAAQLVNQGKVAEALQLYDEVLKANPNQPVALANDGWLLAQAGLAGAGTSLVDTGLAKITQAEKIDPTYTSIHFFRGFLLLQAKNDPAGAVTEFRLYLGAVDPSAPEVPQVEQLLTQAIKAAGPNVPAGPNAPAAQTPPTSAPG